MRGGPRDCRGDNLWRLVTRTIAKQVAEKVEAATVPSSTPLSTKALCECVAHILQTLSDHHVDRWGRCVRPDLPERDAWRPSTDGGRRSDPPFCEMFLREPIHIFMGGRYGHNPVPSHKGRRGAGRPPHANVVCLGTTQGSRSHHREDEGGRTRDGRPERLEEAHTTVEEQ